jgi:hypothetical protein
MVVRMPNGSLKDIGDDVVLVVIRTRSGGSLVLHYRPRDAAVLLLQAQECMHKPGTSSILPPDLVGVTGPIWWSDVEYAMGHPTGGEVKP